MTGAMFSRGVLAVLFAASLQPGVSAQLNIEQPPIQYSKTADDNLASDLIKQLEKTVVADAEKELQLTVSQAAKDVVDGSIRICGLYLTRNPSPPSTDHKRFLSLQTGPSDVAAVNRRVLTIVPISVADSELFSYDARPSIWVVNATHLNWFCALLCI